MIVSAHQPYFCPYPGYFAKAMYSDVFVILDSVQFPRGGSWITRNRFKNDQGPFWMSIPVWKKGQGLQSIAGVRICHEGSWKRKHLESIRTAYGHAPYLQDHLPHLEKIFQDGYRLIRDLDLVLITHVMEYLGTRAKVLLMSELGVKGTGTALLTAICRELGASEFLSFSPARKYLDQGLFREAGIAISYISPPPLVYPQLWGQFIPNLSVFDLLLNCGKKSCEIMERQFRKES
jgi:hypothetical protein